MTKPPSTAETVLLSATAIAIGAALVTVYHAAKDALPVPHDAATMLFNDTEPVRTSGAMVRIHFPEPRETSEATTSDPWGVLDPDEWGAMEATSQSLKLIRMMTPEDLGAKP